MSVTINGIGAYLYVFVRMAGMLALNPVFSRRNVPSQVRVGLIFCLTLLLAPASGVNFIPPGDTLTLLLDLLHELFVGAVCGMVFLIFYYMIFFAGDMMDMQFGLSMARIFDPGTNIQVSVSGNFLNILFILYFFVTDSHLVLLRIFAATFTVVPIGQVTIYGEMGAFMTMLFASAFSLALRLALPFIAAELVLELSMGILMKLIPQIHVFVINFQFKILLGIFTLLIFSQPIGDFVGSYMKVTMESIARAVALLGG